MDRGAWRATVHEVAGSNTTERLIFSLFSGLTVGQSYVNKKEKKKYIQSHIQNSSNEVTLEQGGLSTHYDGLHVGKWPC